MSANRRNPSKILPEAYASIDAFSKTVGSLAAQHGIDDRLKELVLLLCSQANGCAYCVRVHTPKAIAAGVSADELAQLPVWRESGVFSERERAAFALAESLTFIHRGGVTDDVYALASTEFSEQEYAAITWLCVSINAFNRFVLSSRLAVPPIS